MIIKRPVRIFRLKYEAVTSDRQHRHLLSHWRQTQQYSYYIFSLIDKSQTSSECSSSSHHSLMSNTHWTAHVDPSAAGNSPRQSHCFLLWAAAWRNDAHCERLHYSFYMWGVFKDLQQEPISSERRDTDRKSGWGQTIRVWYLIRTRRTLRSTRINTLLGWTETLMTRINISVYILSQNRWAQTGRHVVGLSLNMMMMNVKHQNRVGERNDPSVQTKCERDPIKQSS